MIDSNDVVRVAKRTLGKGLIGVAADDFTTKVRFRTVQRAICLAKFTSLASPAEHVDVQPIYGKEANFYLLFSHSVGNIAHPSCKARTLCRLSSASLLVMVLSESKFLTTCNQQV